MSTKLLCPIWLAAFLLAGTAIATPHKLRVTDPAIARALLANGAKLVGDYGSFQILESDTVPTTNATSGGEQLADNLNYIQLSAERLNTAATATRALKRAVGNFSGRRLHLVQFAGPIQPAWHEGLEQTGVKIVGYIPENAYLVYGDAVALAQMQSWASTETCVQWDGPYQPGYKINPGARLVDARGTVRSIGTKTFAVQLVADPEANAATLRLIDQLKLGPIFRQFEILNYHNIIVALPADRLSDLAAQPDVVSIQPYFEPGKRDERQDQIVAGNLAGSVPGGPGYLAWLTAKGFTQAQFDASGFVVDVSDSGIDNGTTTPGHFGLYVSGDPAGRSRIAYCRLEGKPNRGSTLIGCDGHGALNAHIIAGYDGNNGFPHTDTQGFSYGLGVCPFVTVGSSVIFDPENFTGPNYSTLLSQAYSSGARISNNSWGSDVAGAYDVDAQTYDALVRDVRGFGGNRPMVLVFVAGNAGPASGASMPGIDSPGSAKNVITVGAAENVRSLSTANGGTGGSGDDGCGSPDTWANSANDVAGFSSRGPCADGRMKPDLVAPGTHITGGVPQSSPPPLPDGTGLAISCFDASSVCGLPGSGGVGNPENFFPLGQEFYTVSTGTSHAAPAVSGACALVRQYFINQGLVPPSPAMTKAYLMNSARYLTGANAGDTLWSPSQGMGELDLGNAFDGVPRILRDQVSVDTFTATGQTRAFAGRVVDPARPFRITVAWTDAPGSTTAAQALVNDLDLTVAIGGKTYKGNVFSGNHSVTGGTADSLNNVESVFLPAGVSGDFTVTLLAADIVADGVVAGGSKPEQDFALVIDNATSKVSLFLPSAGSYRGLFAASGGAHMIESGAFATKTTARGAYSGNLRMGSSRYAFSGRFDSFGVASNSIARKGMNPLTLVFQMQAPGNNRLTGTVSDGTWLAQLEADRAAYNARTNPAPFAGKYTLLIPGNAGSGNAGRSPAGDGYGAVTVDASGRVRLKSTLADGARLSQSATVAQDGRWPLYASLYGNRGQILGWLTFSAAHQLNGAISWIRPPMAHAGFYPAGFDVETNIVGSAYQPPPTRNSPVVDFSTGVVTLTGGNLAVGITNGVSIAPNNKVTSDTGDYRLLFSFTPSQGLFKGSLVSTAMQKRIKFGGAIMQDQNFGSGSFLGTNESGAVFFGP